MSELDKETQYAHATAHIALPPCLGVTKFCGSRGDYDTPIVWARHTPRSGPGARRGFALIAVRKGRSADFGGGDIGASRGFRLLNRRSASAGLQERARARSERADADLAYPADHHQLDPGLEHPAKQTVEDEELGQGYRGMEDVIAVPVGWAQWHGPGESRYRLRSTCWH